MLDGDRRADPHGRPRPRPRALRRRAARGHRRADAGPPRARRLRARAAARGAQARGLPVLGICRGLQLINVARGGTLVQDVGRRRLDLAPHRPQLGTFGRHRVDHRGGHARRPACSARASTTSTPTTTRASRELGEGLVVSARADDGSIEAIEDPVAAVLHGRALASRGGARHDRRAALPRARAGGRGAPERRVGYGPARDPRERRRRAPSRPAARPRCAATMRRPVAPSSVPAATE